LRKGLEGMASVDIVLVSKTRPDQQASAYETQNRVRGVGWMFRGAGSPGMENGEHCPRTVRVRTGRVEGSKPKLINSK